MHNLLTEISDRIDNITLKKIINSVSVYLGSSNSQAKKNAENLLNKIIITYSVSEVVGGISESI